MRPERIGKFAGLRVHVLLHSNISITGTMGACDPRGNVNIDRIEQPAGLVAGCIRSGAIKSVSRCSREISH